MSRLRAALLLYGYHNYTYPPVRSVKDATKKSLANAKRLVYRIRVTPNHAMNKLNTFLQEGTFPKSLAALLEADPRVKSYYSEPDDGRRLINITVARGYEYEGRRHFMADSVAEIKEMLRYIEQGEPDPRNG